LILVSRGHLDNHLASKIGPASPGGGGAGRRGSTGERRGCGVHSPLCIWIIRVTMVTVLQPPARGLACRDDVDPEDHVAHAFLNLPTGNVRSGCVSTSAEVLGRSEMLSVRISEIVTWEDLAFPQTAIPNSFNTNLEWQAGFQCLPYEYPYISTRLNE